MIQRQRPEELRDEAAPSRPVGHHALDAYETSGASPPSALAPFRREHRVQDVAPPEQLITTRQLAELWQQTPRWVLRMANGHGLPHYKLGGAIRYRTSEVEDWLQQHRAEATVTTVQDEGPAGLRSVSDERGAA